MNAHRNSNSGGKTPFGTKVILAFVLIVAVVILAWAWGSH